MSKALTEFMASFCGTAQTVPHDANASIPMASPLMNTRGKRRKAINSLISQLNTILDAETAYRDKIPTNLQSSIRYENAEESIQLLEEAIDNLTNVYGHG
jgi:hypothetical protein